MSLARFHPLSTARCAILVAACSQAAVAGTLCVNPAGSHGCYSTIQAAVNHSSANGVVNVEPGTYKEEVTIGIPLSLVGAADKSVINATGLAHGIFVDGFDHPVLNAITIAGFTVQNANYEGILVVRIRHSLRPLDSRAHW
jgi:pectin methylesterase-like acyl-CoA thioesterase